MTFFFKKKLCECTLNFYANHDSKILFNWKIPKTWVKNFEELFKPFRIIYNVLGKMAKNCNSAFLELNRYQKLLGRKSNSHFLAVAARSSKENYNSQFWAIIRYC